MCDPISIAATVATVAGSAINSRAQSKAAQAQVDLNNRSEQMAMASREAERKRQAAFDEDNYSALRTAISDVAPDRQAEKAAEAAAAPDNRVKAAAAKVSAPELPKGTDGTVIADAPEIAKGADRTKQMIDALALLTAQGVQGGATGDRFGRLSTTLSNNNSAGRRSLGVADFESRVPVPRVTANPSPLGDILQIAGAAGSAYGGGGTDPFADWQNWFKSPMTPPSLGKGPS